MSATTTTLSPPSTLAGKGSASDSIPLPPSLRFTPLPNAVDVGALRQKTINDETLQVHVAGPQGGNPCRRCLCGGNPGDEFFLFSYNPYNDVVSPYTQDGPIYIHKSPACELATDVKELPGPQRSNPLVVRGFDEKNNIVQAESVEGAECIGACERIFENPKAKFIHIYYTKFGCFAVRVDRA